MTVTCEQARLGISRQLDGDLPGSAAHPVESHLNSCDACQVWRQRALFLDRTVRAGRLDPPRRGLPPLAPSRRATRITVGVRTALALVAFGCLVIAAPALAFGQDGGLAVHEAHEMGSLEVGLAIGLLVVAWQPRRARGVLAVSGIAATLLVVTATDDIASGETTFLHEAPHALVVIGALLVWMLARRTPEMTPRWPLQAPVHVAASESISERSGISLDARRSG